MSFKRLVGLVVALVVALLAVTGCGSSSEDDSGSSDVAQTSTSGEHYRIALAMIGIPGVKFFNVIRNGAIQAGKDLDIDVVYRETSQFDYNEQARLIRAVIATKPDALVVTDHQPDTLNPMIREATDAGIPVLIANAGQNEVERVGALGFVGQDEEETAELVGDKLDEFDLRNIICFNQEVGTSNLDARCNGIKRTFDGQVTVVGGDPTDRTVNLNRIKATLLRLDDIDGIIGLGTNTGEDALRAVQEAHKESQIKVATYDLTPVILGALRDGRMIFSVDQQQYLQGYQAVEQLALMLRYKFVPAHVLPTGPDFVTEDRAAAVIELSKKDIR
jgi:simple sugar transport system substrate-binding protein